MQITVDIKQLCEVFMLFKDNWTLWILRFVISLAIAAISLGCAFCLFALGISFLK